VTREGADREGWLHERERRRHANGGESGLGCERALSRAKMAS
jgi:hypothetical protein